MIEKKPFLNKQLFLFLPVLLILFFTSCATVKKTEQQQSTSKGEISDKLKEFAEQDNPEISETEEVEKTAIATNQQEGKEEKSKATDIENSSIEDIIKIEEPNTQNLYDQSRYDFPITVNSRVEGWMDYFTGRGRRHMERYLGRSSRYMPRMRKILKREGIPEDLVYLALIESGFSVKAKSRARAVGPWQFISATGKRYGLHVDAWIDERRDPIQSTEAAAKYLKDLYLMFESWYLAAAAYNAGEFRILRAVERLKTNNFWRIRRSRMIRRETKDYVPKLIAAAIIAKNPARYGFEDIAYLEPLEFETVTVNFPVHLREIAKLIDEPVEVLEELNPVLCRKMVPPHVDEFEMRVPLGRKILVERAVATIRGKISPRDIPKQHTVRRGETLYSIANKYRIYKSHLSNVNNLSNRAKLKKGMKLIIPKGGRIPRYRTRSKKAYSKGYAYHKVRKGESLWAISIKRNVTVHELFVWNGLRRSRIFPGMTLKYKRLKNLAKAKTKPKSRKIDSNGFIVHVVARGDTLWSISQAYKVSIRQIKLWNRLRNSRLMPGKRLKIKSGKKS